MVVFKDASVATVFDELKARIEEGEALIRREVQAVSDLVTNQSKALRDEMFSVN